MENRINYPGLNLKNLLPNKNWIDIVGYILSWHLLNLLVKNGTKMQ